MNPVSSAAEESPSSGGVKSASPRGGSPRRASTLSIPISAKRSRSDRSPSRVSPTQLRWAITSSPWSRLIRSAISTVPSRVAPPAP